MRPATFIYVIEAQNGRVKIGVSSAPQRRALTVHQYSPVPCRLIAVWLGDWSDERALHERFADHRVHCEWFRLEGPLAAFVDSVRGTGMTVGDWVSYSPDERAERRQKQSAKHSASMKAVWCDPKHREAMRERREAREAFLRSQAIRQHEAAA
jgi:hypothetical protein